MICKVQSPKSKPKPSDLDLDRTQITRIKTKPTGLDSEESQIICVSKPLEINVLVHVEDFLQ